MSQENNKELILQLILIDEFENDDEDFLEENTALGPPKKRKRRNCIKDYFENVVPSYDEREFMTHFRVRQNVFTYLCSEFTQSTIYKEIADHSRVISAEKHIAVFLWFAGHESCSFRDVGDRFDLTISTVNVVLTRVIAFISNLSEKFIIFPDYERRKISETYYRHVKGFPGVFGAIDGTHVQIDPPSEAPDDYVNRKGYHSVVLQGVCNEKKKFINIFVGFPGCSHDSRVFKCSPIFQTLPRICEDCYLLGDSAYPCLKWCLTPYRDNGHLTAAQKKFNVVLSSSRVCIEHTFGLLKQRFRQLYYLKLKGQYRICHFIRACCVLHNLCNNDDPFLNEEILEHVPENIQDFDNAIEENGRELRDEICRQIFIRHT